ncbi:LysR family transcriptional regulator [Rhizobium binxianense]
MHPRLLKTFLAVARNRSFTRAATEVHLAQSSVSDQIQSLEAELGTELFTRSRSGLQLTRAGEALLSYAEEMQELADEARAAVAEAAASDAGPITIGALETIAAMKLPGWLAAFQKSHPGIGVRLKVAGSGDLLQKLERGEIDIVFCFARGAFDARFASRAIVDEPLILIAPAGSGPASPGPDLAELASRSFVATETGCIYRHMFESAFAEAGVEAPGPAVEVGSIGAIARLVASGAGMGLVPRLAVADALERGEICALTWPGPTQAVPLTMAWRRRRVQPPALKQFLAAAREGFAPSRQAVL